MNNEVMRLDLYEHRDLYEYLVFLLTVDDNRGYELIYMIWILVFV